MNRVTDGAALDRPRHPPPGPRSSPGEIRGSSRRHQAIAAQARGQTSSRPGRAYGPPSERCTGNPALRGRISCGARRDHHVMALTRADLAAALPDLDGSIRLPGLRAAAAVWRDADG